MASASGKPQSPLLLLKDYLRDDLSSCSSSGFKSLPRRQCCLHPRSSSSSCSTTNSALQKASEAVLNAIKSLQIPAPQRSSPSVSQTRRRKAKKGGGGSGGVVSRSFSRRLLSRSFWRRASDNPSTFPTTTFSSANASDSNSWVETSLTCPSLTAAEDSTDTEGSVVTTTTNTCSVTNSTRDWPSEEKEQFSPVSVLDCPLFDDDEEITSPSNSSTCSSLEGAKHKHMQKSRRRNRVAYLKPVALEKRISWSEMQGDKPIYNLHIKPCSLLVSNVCAQSGYSNMLRDNVEEKARDLLNHVKRSIPSNCMRIEAENMLFDFFKQSIWENNDIENSLMKRHLCKVAEDWIRGQTQEQYLSWEVWEGRELYIKEMNKCGSWRNSDEEIQCLAMELEVEFFTSLVNELLLDLTTC